MADEDLPDVEIDTAAARPALWWRGLLAASAAGAAVGLVDGLLALRGGNQVVRGADVPLVVGVYAAFFAPFGLLAAAAARRFEWPARALSLLVGTGAALFLAGAWMNVELLPDFASILSIAMDIGLVIVAVLWFRRRYFGPGEDVFPTRFWAGLGFASAGIALALTPVRGIEDGEAPAAAHRGDARPNVLVYLVDTLRADHLGTYGYAKPTSPEIDAFAADAVVFDDCRAPSSWTKPSVASLLTARYPSAHSCVQTREVLVPDAVSLAEVFRAAGWRTGGFSDNPFVSRPFGFGQGFDHWRQGKEPSVVATGTLLGKVLFMSGLLSLVGEPFGVGEKLYAGARELQEGKGGVLEFVASGEGPWFAYVQAMEPHLPYEPPLELAEQFGFPRGAEYGRPPGYNGVLPFQVAPEPPEEDVRRLVAQYDGEVRHVSQAFGDLLAALARRGELENTVVVFVSDHGEEFHDRGGWTHGHSLHRELVRVPLIVRLPDSLGDAAKGGRGRRVRGVASLLDVFPTLTEVCGIEFPRYADHFKTGVSLGSSLRGADGKRPRDVLPTDRQVLCEVSSGPVELRSIREGKWLFVRATSPGRSATALYDVLSDPMETKDKSGSEAVRAQSMEADMDRALRALEKSALTGSERTLDVETHDHLRGLGYTGGK